MSLSDVRAIASEQRHELRGTPMTVTNPWEGSFRLSVVWDISELEDVGRGRQLKKAFWVRTEDLPKVPRGTEFVGPGPQGGADKTWRADETLGREHGQILVAVTEVLQ